MTASIREQIATDIVETLESAVDPVAIKLVSRNPINSADISIEQYPCIFVRTSSEDRDDASSSSSTRHGTVDFEIIGLIRTNANSNIDTDRNALIQTIEDRLEADRQRNSLALNSTITNVVTDEGDQHPIGRVTINYRVQYKYTRGTT